MGTRLAHFEGDNEKIKEFEDAQRATLNMLEDFDTEKRRLEEVQSATLNLLEDFDAERKRLEGVQRATINILDDFNSERMHSEESQRALLNILEDIDVEKSKVAEFNQQLGAVNKELEASNKELEAFTYSVAHDLRAPLRHADGFSKMLAEELGTQLKPDAQGYLADIQDSIGTMGRLIDDLLSLARIGRQEPKLQTTGLSSLVAEALSELKPEMAKREIEWRIAPLPFVDCDPGLMKQVFLNLLSNAIKYTRPRQPAVIEVGQTTSEGGPVIFVRDNGVGFNMKHADRLFGVFQRLHRKEDFEGTGVGLATVQRIIHKHGGRIWAEAELDKGATFYFCLGELEK